MTTAKPEAARRVRDVRLDVFRGLCLVIIFIAHVWDNAWARYIPARFGFSDATEIFVFCSGMASAIAFGGTFRVHGYLLGALRVAHRCWQVFWSHIGVLMVAVAAMIAVDRTLGTGQLCRGTGAGAAARAQWRRGLPWYPDAALGAVLFRHSADVSRHSRDDPAGDGGDQAR